jgi:hypothetical protein
MTQYYVQPAASGGSDADAGTSVGAAWATIDKALSTMVAGDSCTVQPAVYRESGTCDASGSSGSSITITGDCDGAVFGVVGPVIISAWDDDTSTPTRASCLDMNGKTFVVWNKVQFFGGTSWTVGNTAFGSATAYEGCEFNDCVFEASSVRLAMKIEINAGVTPTAAGLTCRRCVFLGITDIDWDSNGSAHVNLKWLFERCLFIGAHSSLGTIILSREANGGALTIGGVTWNHCTFLGAHQAIYVVNMVNTTNPFACYNSQFIACLTAIQYSIGAAGGFVAANNTFSGVTTPYVTAADFRLYPDSERQNAPVMLGGLHDWYHYKLFGWSPYKPWEPMKLTGIYTDPAIDYGTLDITASNDLYGNPAMGRPSAYGHIYYFDGSDAAASDPNSVWTTEANITADQSLTTFGTVNTTGSTASNYVMAEGTSAPSSGGTITNVYVRMHHKWGSSSGTNAGELKIYTDALGELLSTIAQSTTSTTAVWTSWATLTVPSGGWTWAKVQALEFKAYRTAGATTFQISQIQTYVATTEVAPDAGMVEAREEIIIDSAVFDEGASSGRFDGASYCDFIGIAVLALPVSITIRTRYDSNYTGTLPQMIVSEITGVADQTAIAVGAADTWETLTASFTPTAACLVNIRIRSNDTSATGKCWFDDLQPPVY